MRIPLSHIQEPEKPIRVDAMSTDIAGLAESIKAEGQLQDIGVEKLGEDSYRVIFGHRRYLAHKFINAPDIGATVIEAGKVGSAQRKQLIENIHRENLSIAEEADALMELKWPAKTSLRQKAAFLGKTREWITNREQVFKMADELKYSLHNGDIGFGVALELSRVEEPAARQKLLGEAVRTKADAPTVASWVGIDEAAQAGVDAAAASQPPPPSGDDSQPPQTGGQTSLCFFCKQPFHYSGISHISFCRNDLSLIESFRDEYNKPPEAEGKAN